LQKAKTQYLLFGPSKIGDIWYQTQTVGELDGTKQVHECQMTEAMLYVLYVVRTAPRYGFTPGTCLADPIHGVELRFAV
jgi:hypothetical protein